MTTQLILACCLGVSEYRKKFVSVVFFSQAWRFILHMKVYSHQVPVGLIVNISAGVKNATDRLDDKSILKFLSYVLKSDILLWLLHFLKSWVRRRYSMFLRANAWSIVSKEMTICGYYGKAPGPES